MTIENVKVTVKSRLRIRGKVIYPDGTPLADAQGRLNMDRRHEFLNHSGSHGTDFFIDADGYFVQYMDEPGFYAVSVEYNDLSAGVGPFLLKDGVQPEEIVFTLESKPVAIPPPVDDIPAPGDIEFREPPTPPPAKSVWVINPTNGHAYKRIQCEDWHDAQRQAVEEGAHLVSINDEEEQHWLQVIFGGPPFWIGLTDVEEEESGSGIAANRSLTPIGQPVKSTATDFQMTRRTMLCSPLCKADGSPSVLKALSGEWHDTQLLKKMDWFLMWIGNEPRYT